MLEVPVKHQSGDTVYTTKKTRKVCHICEGQKTIIYNGKDMRCPECMGSGKSLKSKSIHVVIEQPFDIIATRITIKNDGEITVKYRGACGFQQLTRTEDNLFTTKEEAQLKCDELNNKTVLINIADITIQDVFEESHPSIEKVQCKLDYYKNNGKFKKDIIIDKDNVLQDGYINYLLCKTLNIKTTKATVAE